MIRRRFRSRSPELAAAAAALIAAGVVARAPPCAAQACCAGASVITPTRLAPHEDYAVAAQMRARTQLGSFGSAGTYSPLAGDEQVLEQSFAASVRFLQRAQAGLLLRGVATRRSLGGREEWGGGFGDLALVGRYDFRTAADAAPWPGLAVLVGATIPTGTAPDQARQPLATDATGAGTYDVSVGLAVEEVRGHLFAWLNGWLTQRFARTVTTPGAADVTQSFALRWRALTAVGWVFDGEAAVAGYFSAMHEGDATINGVTDMTTGLRLATAGLAAMLPLGDRWRLQGSIESDLMISSFGRNQPAGAGFGASLVRVWF
jgi:hypothetical protein